MRGCCMHICHGASRLSCTSTSIRYYQDSLLAYVVASAEPARRTHERSVRTGRKMLTAIDLLQDDQMVLFVPRDTFDGSLVNTLALAIRLHVISGEIQRPGFGREYRRIPELFGQVTNVCADISVGTALPAPLVRLRIISWRVTLKEVTDLHVELGTLLSNTSFACTCHTSSTSPSPFRMQHICSLPPRCSPAHTLHGTACPNPRGRALHTTGQSQPASRTASPAYAPS